MKLDISLEVNLDLGLGNLLKTWRSKPRLQASQEQPRRRLPTETEERYQQWAENPPLFDGIIPDGKRVTR